MDALEGFRTMITEIVRAELASMFAPVELLSTEQAAAHCGVAVGTIRRWIREGRLETQHAGRRLRVRRADLEALLTTPTVRGARKSRPSPEIAAARALARRSLAKR